MNTEKKFTGMKLPAAGLILLLLLSGCSLLSPRYIEPHEYDLASFEEPLTGIQFELGTFRNLSGSDRRFLYREARNRMRADDYNRWLLTPDLMLERQLQKALSPDESGKSVTENLFRVGGTIYRFEFDREKKLAILTVEYTIRQFADRRSVDTQSLSLTTQQPVVGNAPDDAAAAMSEAVRESIAAVRRFLIESNAKIQEIK